MVAQIDGDYIRARPGKLYSRLVSYGLFEGRPLTTRGRWINPLVFGLFALEKRLPVMRPVKEPVFILGTGRSGTTILGIVLSMHRDVGFLNEPKALWHSAYGAEDLIGSYSRGPARYRLDETDATPAVVQAMHRLFSAYLLGSGSRRVVDKYPELIFRVPFVRAIFPDAKFLFLARNGWDTCHSIEHWSERLGEQRNGEVHDWWGVDSRKWNLLTEQLVPADEELAPHMDVIRGFKRHTDRAAVEWILTMREGLRLRARHPDCVHTVLYEDLVNRPAEALAALRAFCNLGEDATFDEYARRVLRPAPRKAPCELHPCIRDAFDSTMRMLDYTA